MKGRLTVAAVFLVTTGLLNANEKYWIAHEAELIVVGTLRPYPIFPWFDGWHMTGTIDVDEVLLGSRPRGPIAYQWTCAYSMCNGWWGMIQTRLKHPLKGIWFLRPLDGRTWKPSVGPGFADLSDRADFEDYIRRYRR
jgi:hypothetical protein